MVEWFERYAIVINALSNLIIFLGAPVAVINYVLSKRQERIDRQYGTYDALDDKYIEFQKMCLEKPYLNVFDIDDELQTELTPLQKKEEIVAYSILMAVFERAYIMYHERGKKEGGQWEGWLENILDYCKRKNFIEAWEKNGWGWDERFEKLINDLIEENKKPVEGNQEKDDKNQKPQG